MVKFSGFRLLSDFVKLIGHQFVDYGNISAKISGRNFVSILKHFFIMEVFRFRLLTNFYLVLVSLMVLWGPIPKVQVWDM